ncbi:MAG: tetratricopeptide repeat protein [bacterium]|nr:tetratricopeptide repeat protein [bacterium]
MSQEEGAPVKGRRRVDYYKWLAGVIVPLLVAVIGLLKFGGSDTTKTPGNFNLITNISLIENQYLEITGQPLNDPEIKQLLQSAVNLAKARQYEASRPLFEKLVEVVPVPAVYNNLGALYAEAGAAQKAREAYQKALARDPDFDPVNENLAALDRVPDARPVADGREAEPNHDIRRANAMPLSTTVAASISDIPDVDYFQFEARPPPRDILEVALRNASTSLAPVLTLYDGEKNAIHREERGTPGADLVYPFSAQAGATYYLSVGGGGIYGGSAGAYTLTVTPLKRFDRFEPNDEISDATRITTGKTIEADLMDNTDHDFYQLSSSGAGDLSVTITRTAATLAPYLRVFDGEKNAVHNEERGTPGADLQYSFSAQPGATYYFRVSGDATAGGSAGSYALTVK